MKHYPLILIILLCCVVGQGQIQVKEVIKVTTDLTGTANCVTGKIYYNATSLVNWERNNSGVCAAITSGGTPGNVVGPASAVDGHLAVFDLTTGKIIKDGGAPSTGSVLTIGCTTAVGVSCTSDGSATAPRLTFSLTGYELTANKDATGGYAGLTGFKINFKNAANTFTSFFQNANTAARTYTFQNRDGTIADDTDLALKAPLASPTFTGTVGLPTVTLGGTISGGGNQINNVIIGTSTPLAGFFTNVSATGSISTGVGGSVAGTLELVQGTAPSLGTNSIKFYAPTSVPSGFAFVWPTASSTGFLLGTDAAGVNTISIVGSSGTGNVARVASPTFTGTVGAAAITQTGQHIVSLNGAASTPPLTLTGSWFSGGSTTTTKPQLLVEANGAGSTGWAANGTGVGVNAPSGFTGNLMSLQLNGTAKMNVDSTGAVITNTGGNLSTFNSGVSSSTLAIGSGTTILKHLSATATLDFANLAAIGCEDLTITVTGAALGDTVAIGVPNGSVVANGTFTGWVSASNTISIRFCTVVSGDPVSGTFRADVWQH